MPAANKCVCPLKVTGRPIRDNFYRFQTVPVACERIVNMILPFDFPALERLYKLSSFLVRRTPVRSGKGQDNIILGTKSLLFNVQVLQTRC